jgi:hypothetical protein
MIWQFATNTLPQRLSNCTIVDLQPPWQVEFIFFKPMQVAFSSGEGYYQLMKKSFPSLSLGFISVSGQSNPNTK